MQLFRYFIVLFSIATYAETLNWSKALSEVAQNNPTLFSGESSLQSAQLELKAQYGELMPVISGVISQSRSGSADVGGRDSSAAQLQISQNIFSGFSSEGQIKAQKVNVEVKRQELIIARAVIGAELINAFVSLSYAQRYIALMKEIVARRENNLKLVELRYEAGKENKGSYLLGQAALAEAQYDLLSAQKEISIGQQRLAQVLGRGNDDELSVEGDIPEIQLDANLHFIQMADETPLAAKLNAQVEHQQAQLLQTRSSLWPKLTLSTSYGMTDQEFFPQNKNWQMGLTLTIPFFSGGSDYYSTMAQQKNLLRAKYDQKSGMHNLITELKEEYWNLKLAQQKVVVDEQYLQALKVRAKISRGKYNNGLMTFEDWDLIENDLISREKNYLFSWRARGIATGSWLQVQGRSVME